MHRHKNSTIVDIYSVKSLPWGMVRAVTDWISAIVDLAAKNPTVESHHHGLASWQEDRVVLCQPVCLPLTQFTALPHRVKHLWL